MIPYELILTSAARPHLLTPTLTSLFAHLDQRPARVLVHDDAAFPGRWLETKRVLAYTVPLEVPALVTHADPPRRIGLALAWLLANTQTEYVLYSQDDFVTVRPLPIQQALEIMEDAGLHHIRFNKRATLAAKQTWQGLWHKEERTWHVRYPYRDVTLTVADHWYFQTSLWRVAPMRAALAYWLHPTRIAAFARGPAEVLLNSVLDGERGPVDGLDLPLEFDPTSGRVRAHFQKTFIWGRIGEDRYVRHIGGAPAHWAGQHARDAGERSPAKEAQAWAEIQSYALEGGTPEHVRLREQITE